MKPNLQDIDMFDEKSGIVSSPTPWGKWSQTVEDVNIEINLEQGTKGKEVSVKLTTTSLDCSVRGNQIIKGNLCHRINTDESTWTIEDRKLLRIYLVKCVHKDDDYWESLLEGQYQPDPQTLLKMRKKLDLERYQKKNPEFDFSEANSMDQKYKNLGLDSSWKPNMT